MEKIVQMSNLKKIVYDNMDRGCVGVKNNMQIRTNRI